VLIIAATDTVFLPLMTPMPGSPSAISLQKKSLEHHSGHPASKIPASKPQRPPILGTLEHHESTSTPVGSAFERKITNDQESIHSKPDTAKRWLR